MKILLAEDDINLGKLLSMLLKKQNITVNWVQDGEAAYDAVYADGYNVLVLACASACVKKIIRGKYCC